MRSHDIDPDAAMAPFVVPFAAYHERTKPKGWLEGLVKAYVGDGIAKDFYREMSVFVDDDTREVMARALDDAGESDFVVGVVRDTLKTDRTAGGRLALWGRRLLGEALSQAQAVAVERDAMSALLVGGGVDLAEVGQMFTRLTDNHPGGWRASACPGLTAPSTTARPPSRGGTWGRDRARSGSDLLLARDRPVDDHEDGGGGDGDEPADPVDADRVALVADQAPDPVADEGAEDAEDDGDDQVDVLLAGEHDPGEDSDDGSEDDGAENLPEVHSDSFRGPGTHEGEIRRARERRARAPAHREPPRI